MRDSALCPYYSTAVVSAEVLKEKNISLPVGTVSVLIASHSSAQL